MKLIVNAAVTLMLVLVPCQTVLAQSASMPLPGLVVKDADGKLMGQVAGFFTTSTDADLVAVVALNVDGRIAYLVFRPYGLIDRVAADAIGTDGPTVHFLSSDCLGESYVNPVSETGLEALSGNMYGVAGPDPITGVYQLYRSTTLTPVVRQIISVWEGGICQAGGTQINVLAAEEVTSNPLAGFHGPTDAQPERIWTVSGGDKLP